MVQEGADMGERLPEEHAVYVLRQMHDQLIKVVQEAMRDRGNPDGVLNAIDEAVRQWAVAARKAVDVDSGVQLVSEVHELASEGGSKTSGWPLGADLTNLMGADI